MLRQILSSGHALLPELLLALGFVLVVVLDLVPGRWAKAGAGLFTALAFAAVLAASVWQVQHLVLPQVRVLSMLQLDGGGIFATGLFAIAGLLTQALYQGYRPFRESTRGAGERKSVLLALVLGLCLMVKASNLLLLFLSIELVSLSSYVLTVLLTGRQRALEAGVKYILIGALTAGIMLYGMSWLYGLTGSLDFAWSGFGARLVQAPVGLVLLAVGLTFAGFFFKAAAVPLHVWAPDVYEAAPTPVVALFSTAPKIAAVLVLWRVGQGLSPEVRELFSGPLLGGVALLSLLIGNLAALRQKSVKRLLAYSSISHIGFMLLPLVAGGENAVQTVLFYAVAVLLANFAVFGLVQSVEGAREQVLLSDFDGLGMRHPAWGVALVWVVLALTGLPPTLGFTAKLLVFTGLLDGYNTTAAPELALLLGAGLLLTVVALFYYLQLPYRAFFRRNHTGNPTVTFTGAQAVLLTLLCVLLLLFFVKADWLLDVIQQVAGLVE